MREAGDYGGYIGDDCQRLRPRRHRIRGEAAGRRRRETPCVIQGGRRVILQNIHYPFRPGLVSEV